MGLVFFNPIFHGVHYSDYKEIWLTGTNGTGIGQFKIPHSVTVDPVGRVKNKGRIPFHLGADLFTCLSTTQIIFLF